MVVKLSTRVLTATEALNFFFVSLVLSNRQNVKVFFF